MLYLLGVTCLPFVCEEMERGSGCVLHSSCCSRNGAADRPSPLQRSAHLLYKDSNGMGVGRRERSMFVGRGQELGALGGASLTPWFSAS